MKIKIWQAALVAAVISCVVCLPALNNHFVAWDDAQYIYQNSHLTRIDGEFFRWAFFDQYWLLWMPLTWLSFALDYQFWGLNPFGFHLTSLLLHAVNTYFVALLTAQLVTIALRDRDTPHANASLVLCALVGGLLFALHPLKAEPVAWASDRKGLLNAVFAIPALMMYLRYACRQAERRQSLAERLGDRDYLTTLLLFLLSLLCKPMSVTLPVILLILDWFPLRRFTSRSDVRALFVEKFPFFAIAIAVSLLTLYLKPVSGISFSEISPWSRLYVACRSLLEYLRLMVWPSDLMALYDHPGNSVAVFTWQFAWPIVSVIVITLACIYRARSDRSWLTVWLCYATILLPVLGFAQNGGQAMADRFMYLPGIALTILVAAGSALVFRQLAPGGRLAFVVGIFSVIAGYGLVTHGLIRSWHDTETLWTRAVTVRPNQAGRAYYQRGTYWLEKGDYERAGDDATRSLEILNGIGYSRIAKVYALRVEAYEKMGQHAAAARDREILESLPSAWVPQR